MKGMIILSDANTKEGLYLWWQIERALKTSLYYLNVQK